MRLPGTLGALLAQVKASPVPVSSISVPTENGPLTLTFGPAAAPVPHAPAPKLTEARPLRERDTVGAFRTPPIGREEQWQPPKDSA